METTSQEDEVDYMSDDLLLLCNDVRPGLVSKNAARQYETSRKRKEADQRSKVKPLVVQAQERREEGLSNAITADNKGYALLEKMGYKPGSGIGKEGKGRTEPVPVEVKLGRGGLGQETEIQRKRQYREAFNKQLNVHKAKKMADLQDDFRQRLANKQTDKQVLRDLYKSQKVCEELDVKNKNLSKPEESFFWPERVPVATVEVENEEENGDDDDEEAEELDVSEKLDILTEYLRTTYFYCIWCGATYSDEGDLNTHCPGDTAEDHDE